jgi:hypothetical protein
MAVVQNTYTGDGVTVLYSLSFPYLDRSDVKVSVNGTIVTNYIFATDTSIQFLAAPGAGASIRIYRDTDNEETKATIFPGSAIKAQDLNANFSQTLYSVQEIAFRALSKFGDTMLGILNMGGFKITNLGTPTSSTDASTKAYVDGVIATGAANAAAAAASASAAAGSASSAAATYDAFDDRYLGSKPTDPALDNDGNALITGALYFNSTSNVMRVWNGATWQDSSANANVLRWRKTAVGGETSLSGADDNAATLTYTVNLEFVYLNGVLLTRGVDYTASNGTSITGLVALEAGDVVEVLSYSSFSLVNVPGSTIQDGTISTQKFAPGAVVGASFTQAGTGAVARTVDSKLKDVVSVKDFGAVGDGVADDTGAIQAAINAVSKGVLYFPPGNYKITSMVTITKNGQNDSTQSCLEIQATGAKLVSTVAPALRITQTKRLTIIGLQVDAPVDPANASVYVTGMWNSTWKECLFGDVAFTTAAGLSDFDQAYWNRFEKCGFRQLIINTGTPASRFEFNANTFDTCRIWGGEYAIKKYGSHTIEDVVFVNCDISYQSTGILYVDEACGGTLQFVGGYFDSSAGFPSDLKGLTVDFIGRVWNPNDANVSAFRVADGSRTESKGIGGARSGSRYPVSSHNLIINGDLRGGTTGILTSNASLSMQTGPGVFGRYVKITSGTAFGTVTFTPIALPFDGTYTLTVIGRVNTGGNSVNITNGISNAIQLDTTWTVDSFTFSGSQGTQPTFAVQNGATGSFDIDIAYVGLTYGGAGQLYTPIHPTADRFTYPYAPAALSGSKTTSSQAASIATVVVGSQSSVSFMVRALFVDSSYPQYNATCVYMFSGMTPNARPTVASLTQLQAHASGLDITAVPVITSSVSGTTITLTASVSPATSGEASVAYEITNIFNPSGNTITLL